MIIGALLVGILIGLFVAYLYGRRKRSSGSIVVHKSDEKIVYSLELDVDPEKIQFEKKVVFKVVVPDEESNRE